MKMFNRKGSKVWWGRWSANGRQFRISSHTEDEKLAKEYLAAEYAKSFKEVRLGEQTRRTWADATKRYLDEHKTLRTLKQYEKYSEWWTGEFKKAKLSYLDEITPDAVKIIRDTEMLRPKQRGKGQRSPADVNRKLAYLGAVMNAVYSEYRWFGANATAPLYKHLPGEVERMRWLKPSEFNKLTEKLPQVYGKMSQLAVATGLRRSNVMKMQWSDVDFGSRTVTIPGMRMKNGEIHSIPLNELAVQLLRSQWGQSETWVFVMEDGSPPKEIPSKVWKRALKDAGLKNVRWHDLRHTWASLARQNGAPLEAIQELGGWKDARMVMRYSHLSVDHLRDHAKVLDRAFSTDLAQSVTTDTLRVA